MSPPPRDAAARILIIDDEPVVQDVLGRLLARAGYGVLAADTAAAGLQSARVEAPDLVILDVMLPDRNGLEVLHELRAGNEERAVIMMTGRLRSSC